LHPLVPFLAAARACGHETLVIGPPAMAEHVGRTGFDFRAGGEPDETEIAPIREQLPVVPRAEAAILGNRELFGRLATTAMLPAMRRLSDEWRPDLVLRDPCEYASAVVAHERDIPTAQVAISLADVELGSIMVATPALEAHAAGLADALRASPYLTRFPESVDRSSFAVTYRYHEPRKGPIAALPDWWPRHDGPLVYLTFGTVLGHMSIALDVFRAALDAVADLPVRVLLTIGHRLDPSTLGVVPCNVHVERWVDQSDVFAVCRRRGVSRRIRDDVRRAGGQAAARTRADLRRPVRERDAYRGDGGCDLPRRPRPDRSRHPRRPRVGFVPGPSAHHRGGHGHDGNSW
jgi:hypothetical protein